MVYDESVIGYITLAASAKRPAWSGEDREFLDLNRSRKDS